MREPSGSARPSRALRTAAGIAVLGVVAAVATQNWIWLVAVAVGGAIGTTRYVAYRRTGTWR